MALIYKTTSELLSYAECPQKHQFGYQMQLSPKRPRERLEEGTILHRVMQEYYNTREPALCLAKLNRLLDGYRARFEPWARDKADRDAIELEIVRLRAVVRAYLELVAPRDYERYAFAGNEIEFAFELWPARVFAGKIDSLFIERESGAFVLVDHKYQKTNTGEDRFVKYQPFWYLIGLERDPALGIRCRRIVYNLVKHPELKLTKEVRTLEALEDRIYEDVKMRLDWYVNRPPAIETSEGMLASAERIMRVLYRRSMEGPEDRYAVPSRQCDWMCAFKPPCFDPTLSQEEFHKLYFIRERAHPELSVGPEEKAA